MQCFGEKGIIKKAQEAKKMYEQSVKREEEEMNLLLQEYENAMAEPPDPTENWDLDKVDAVISEDGVFVPVPKGYKPSTIDGEKSVETGFVIKEGTNGGATEGINEFVWVPVSVISDLYDGTNNAGQLWSFGSSSSPKNPAEKSPYPTTKNDGNREPDVITGAAKGEDSSSGSEYDADPANLEQAGLPAGSTATDFKAQLQREFNTMKDSVEKYGGFYIGRYETGDLSKAKAVVQKNNSDIFNMQTWYTMYKLSKTVGANDNVVSSMIWGCQWDATMRWMQTSSIEKVKNFPTDSMSYGNYMRNEITYVENGETKTKKAGTAAKIPTGSSEQTKINNIYDLGGNASEETLAAYDNSYRASLGYSYTLANSWASVGDATGLEDPMNPYPSKTSGVRVSLYIAL